VKVVMVILLSAMIIKDAGHIGDPFILRGFSQVLCLIVGTFWILLNADVSFLKKYWPIFGYCLVSLISGLLSPRMDHALMQTASLTSVLFFAIAYFESQSKKSGDPSKLYFNTTIILYSIACIVSVLLIKLNYSLVYGKVAASFVTNAVVRFNGVYSTPGMMGAASGLLIGFILFRKGKWWWRGPALTAALICLALTTSRTFWVASFVSSIIVWWIYKPQSRKLVAIITVSTCLVAGSLWFIGVSVDTKGVEKSARVSSLSTLTGRIPLWEMAIDGFSKRPIIGYGSTIGAYALRDDSGTALYNSEGPSGQELGRETLHNGYIQSVLDLGALGLFFYVAIFYVAIYRIYHRDKLKLHGSVIYGVLFVVISNFGESVVYSASTSHSIVFWCLVVFGLYRFSSSFTGGHKEDGISITENQEPSSTKGVKFKTVDCKLR